MKTLIKTLMKMKIKTPMKILIKTPDDKDSDEDEDSDDSDEDDEDEDEIEFEEGETLEDIKAKLKPKKSTISLDMLDTANSYDDKVAIIRMLVSEDSTRVANVLKRMIDD